VPEPAVFNSLIGLCGKSGEGEYALRIFAYMKQLEVIPNSTTFRALVAACLNAGDSARAEQATHTAHPRALGLALVMPCGSGRARDGCRGAVHEMAAAGWEPDAETAESLLRAVASRQGEARLDEAARVVDALRFQAGAPPPLAPVLDEAAFGAALRQLHASLPPAGKPGESASRDRLRAAVEAVAAAHTPSSTTAASGGAGEEA
ncbi:hypothetical protein EMIHUDRAFT_125082, partial [Emiliania huxleyi CCMP1516]